MPAEHVIVPHDDVGRRIDWPLFWSPCNFPKPGYNQILFTVPASIPGEVRSIAFRRGRADAAVNYPAFSVDLSIGMGHSSRGPANPSHDVADNRGSDFTMVVPRQQVSFPASPARTSLPFPFEYRIPLARPFSLRPGSSAIIELRTYATTACPGNERFEWYFEDKLSNTEFGVACAQNEMVPGNVYAGNPGRAVQFPQRVSGLGAHGRIFGGLRNDLWNGLRLPYTLDHLGAPGCSLYISFDWEWPRYWDTGPGGFTYADLTLPNDPALAGRTIYAQGVRFDTAVNALGLATSQGWAVPVNPHFEPPISSVWGPEGPNGLAGGQVLIAFGPVFQLSDR